MQEKREIAIAIVLLLTLSTLSSWSTVVTVNADEITREESLVLIGTSLATIGNFNPLSSGSGAYRYSNVGVMEPLYLLDLVNGGIFPWLADGQPTWIDEYTLEVKLKSDVYWHDGEPFTAEDVKYTWELPTRGYYSGLFEAVGSLWLSGTLEDIDVIDPITIHFLLNQSNPTPLRGVFIGALAGPMNGGPILPKHIFEQAETEYDSLYDFQFQEFIGTGPYKLIEWNDQRVVGERWDDWWGIEFFGKTVAPKYYIYAQATSNEDALRKMIAGEADFVGAAVPRYPELRSLYGIKTYHEEPPFFHASPFIYDCIGFNLPKMEEKFGEDSAYAIRLAMGYAVDREAISTIAGYDISSPLYDVSLIPPGSILDSLRPEEFLADNTFSYNPDKAKQILDAAGIMDYDSDGIRELPDQTTEVILRGYSVEGWGDWMAGLELLVSYCEEIGIVVDQQVVDFTIFLTIMTAGEDWELYTWQRSMGSLLDYYTVLAPFDDRAVSWPLLIGTGESGNVMGYSNEEMETLRDQIAQYFDITDPSVRSELSPIVSRVTQLVMEELPIIPIYTQSLPFVYIDRYWTGWPTEDNPYPHSPNIDTIRLPFLLHLVSTSGPAPPPAIPEDIMETIEQTFARVSALQTSQETLTAQISQLSSLTENLIYANIGISVVVLVVLIYLVVTRKR